MAAIRSRRAAARNAVRIQLAFHEGRPVYFQALNDDLTGERGLFRNSRPFRYTVCGADGEARRSFHVGGSGRAFATIDRSSYTDYQTYDARDGWMYSFFHEGTKMAEVFATDAGPIRMAAVRNEGAMFTLYEFDDGGYLRTSYKYPAPDFRRRAAATQPSGAASRPAE